MMTSNALNAPRAKFATVSRWVWFTGSAALYEGMGVCFNYDTTTGAAAILADGNRGNEVELPSATNARYFAGVAARDYSAHSGGQMIEIYEPGSFCNVYAKANCTLGTGRLTCEAGGTYAGYFRYAGFEGQGSARPLQTIDRTTAGKVFAQLESGPQSGLVQVIVANDDGLLDGGATACMVGGVTYFDADISTGANATDTLADGTLPGLKKAFNKRIAQTSNIVITVASGVQGVAHASPTTALNSITLDNDKDEICLEWNGLDDNGVWVVTHSIGPTLA